MSTGTYTFYSWLRRGLAGQIKQPDPLGTASGSSSREKVALQLNIKPEGGEPVAIGRELTVYGPGDIIGIDRRNIIKTEPQAGIGNFEPNYLPYIEFYEEDFPWRYTPAAANNNRLRPWLALIVLKETEFEHLAMAYPLLPSIRVLDGPVSGPFPRADQTWAWAHVQLNQQVASDSNGSLEQLLREQPNQGSSRLLCPRRLEDDTSYHAFLIPSFEVGRLAGLGADDESIAPIDNLRSSWGQEQQLFPGVWPVYYEWQFRTGPAGDFESLSRKIKPRKELDPAIGREPMDLQDPGYGLHYGGEEGGEPGTIFLEGALQQLRVPENVDGDTDEPGRLEPVSAPPMVLWEEDEEAQKFVRELEELLNLEEELKDRDVTGKYALNPFFQEEEEQDGDIYGDPIITPPFYGKFQAFKKLVDHREKNHWYNQLNLDPKFRAAAGFGVQVVQRKQDEYMERAWRQYGEIMEANRQIRREQLSLQASRALFKKHFVGMDSYHLTQMTAPVHAKIRVAEESVAKTIETTQTVTDAFVDPAFTRLTRPRGPLMRKLQSNLEGAFQPFSGSSENWTMPGAEAYKNTAGEGAMVAIEMTAIATQGAENIEGTLQDHFSEVSGDTSSGDEKTDLNLNEIKSGIEQELDPEKRIPGRVKTRMSQFMEDGAGDNGPAGLIRPIIAAPKFPDPTYEELVKISSDFLLPNIDQLPDNSFCTFATNNRFIEAFLVGVNHEMSRELLWREFPTDQRGTYFRQFWDTGDRGEDAADIHPIHLWGNASPLGDESHTPRPKSGDLVFAIRGEVLRKFPNTLVFMQEAAWAAPGEATDDNTDPPLRRQLATGAGTLRFPEFQAKVDPDIYFFGFSLSVEEALGQISGSGHPGWFFVLKEPSGEARFGLDIDLDPEGSVQDWENFSWADLPEVQDFLDLDRDFPEIPIRGGVAWGKGEDAHPEDPASGNGSAADMAYILFQKPFMVAVHAQEMLG